MDANLDLLLTIVYCIADDFLPKRPGNARRKITDAEIVALCIAQAIMGIPSDPRFFGAATRLGICSRSCPPATRSTSAGCGSRADRGDDRPLRASEPRVHGRTAAGRLHPGRVRPLPRNGQARRASSLADALANAADYGYCASHSRHFWGFRLHALFAPDGTPRALALTSPKIDEKLVCVQMVARCERTRTDTDPDRRQELPRQRLRDRTRRTRRHDPAPPAQRRDGPRPAPRADPPTNRIDLPDLQRHPHPRTPRRPHPRQPPRPPLRPIRRARRRRHAQPPTRPPQPQPRRLHP